MNNIKTTPDGTRDYLFNESKQRRKLERELSALYEANGFAEVITPIFEFYNLYDFDRHSASDLYTFTDSKGRIVALRPESTASVARLAQTRLRKQLDNVSDTPVKVYYNQTIIKNNPKDSGRDDEIVQSGVEFIGCDDDTGFIKLAQAATAVCDGNCRVEIGDSRFFLILSRVLKLDGSDTEKARALVEQKNIPGLSEMFARGTPAEAVMCRLPLLYGGSEVFDTAERLFRELEQSEVHEHDWLTIRDLGRELSHLKAVYNAVSSQNTFVDLGMVKHYNYYNGIIVAGYIHNLGIPVLTGGRYDNFVRDGVRAAGFAVNVTSAINRATGDPNKRLRIALTKGRIEKDTIALLEKCGFDCTSVRDKGRQLIVTIRKNGLAGGEIDIMLAKAPDVITYVSHGVCDLGIVGKDVISEHGSDNYELLDLKFGKCRFALAGVAGKYDEFCANTGVRRVASKYVNVTRKYLADSEITGEIIKIEGSVELAPLVGLADAIVDIVETGDTLRANGLDVYETVCEISARVIANPVSAKLKKRDVDSFPEALAGVI